MSSTIILYRKEVFSENQTFLLLYTSGNNSQRDIELSSVDCIFELVTFESKNLYLYSQ